MNKSPKPEKWTIGDVTRQAIVAAVYTAISLLLAPVSFGNMGVEFRLAESLMVMPYFNKKYIVGVSLGCLLTNLFSPIGLPDIIFGTLATVIACALVAFFANKWLVVPIATIINALIVGALLYIEGVFTPFLLSVAIIGIGELAVTVIGVVFALSVERSSLLNKLIRGYVYLD